MLYTYKAFKDNKLFTKKIESENEAAVLSYLKTQGYLPIEVKKAQSVSFIGEFFNRVGFDDVVDLTRQLAIMINAGLTLIDSFDILKKQSTKPAMVKLIDELDKEVRSGSSFSSALKKYPQYFSGLYIALVRSGEASGKLSEILLKLADNLEKQREFAGKMKGALIYPIIVIVAMVGVMFVMITFVIPKLLDLYKDFNIDLPLSTKILMFVSGVSTRFWPLIIGGTIGGFMLFKQYMRTKQGKSFGDHLVLKTPVISDVVKISALVDSTRTLSILIASGVSILDGLAIIIDTTENVVYKNAFENVAKQVEKGLSLGTALSQEHVFPPLLVQMVIVGEQTGHLDETLLRISTFFEMQSALAVKAMTTLIEPLVLVFLGIGVGFLVISVITPIYNLTSSFQ